MASEKGWHRQSDASQGAGAPRRTAPRWRGRLIMLILAIVVAAVILRAARGSPAPAQPPPGQAPGMTTGLVPGQPGGQTAEPPPEPSTLDTILPFVTEGGFAMILGLLLGMATRSILKFVFVLVLLGFVGIQYLAYKQVLTVDWGAFKDFILNVVPPGADLAMLVQKKLPTLGSFGLGYMLGLKRG